MAEIRHAKLIPQIEALNEANERTKSGAEAVGQSFREAFGGVVTGAMKAKDAVAQLLAKFAEMLASAAWDGLVSGLGSAGAGSGGGFFAGVRKILGFANGTNSAPGGLAMVGERGRELVNLPRGSRVYPNAVTEQMLQGGGGATSVHLTLSPDLEARILGQAQDQSVRISRASVEQNNRALPDMVKRYSENTRKRY